MCPPEATAIWGMLDWSVHLKAKKDHVHNLPLPGQLLASEGWVFTGRRERELWGFARRIWGRGGRQGGDSSQGRNGMITQGGTKARFIIGLLFFDVFIVSFCNVVFLRHSDHWSFEVCDLVEVHKERKS